MPEFSPGEPVTLPDLFFLSRQTHGESTRVFVGHTSVVIEVKELKQPVSLTLNCVLAAARFNLRTVDLHVGVLQCDSSMIGKLINAIKEWFPTLATIYLTLETRSPPITDGGNPESGELLAITYQTLSNLLEMPLLLTRVRLIIEDAFGSEPNGGRSNLQTLTSFQTFVGSLSDFPKLEEVEVYFRTIGSVFLIHPTSTSRPERPAERCLYVELEEAVISPYLSKLSCAASSESIWDLALASSPTEPEDDYNTARQREGTP
jgi:hypothetical protein